MSNKADLLRDLGIGGRGAITKTRARELGDVLAVLLVSALAPSVESHAGTEDLTALNLEDATGPVFRHAYVAGAAANTAITVSGIESEDQISIIRFKGLQASPPSFEGIALVDADAVTVATNSITLPFDTSEDTLLVLWVDESRI